MTGIGIESIECNISDGLSGTQVVRCLGVQKWFFAHRSIITSKLCGKTPLSVSIDIPRWMNSIRKQKLNANASQKSTQSTYTMATAVLAIKYCLFKGKSSKDANAHIRQFDKAYGLNHPGPLDALHKESMFESILFGKALKWLAELPSGSFYNLCGRIRSFCVLI